MSSWQSLDDIPPYPEEDKGFEVKCLNCGSTNCVIKEQYDYNSDDELVYCGHGFMCFDCGQTD